MKTCINPDTYIVDPDFVPSEVEAKYGWTKGTVEVTLRNETRRLPASKTGDYLTARGLGGRYQTGTKVWDAFITLHTGGRLEGLETYDFGRDDRAPQFKKLNGIFFKD
jgi:hypothetical protein